MAKDDWGDDGIRDYELATADGEKILKSLEKIKFQTSRHLCIHTGLSIGTVVDWLEFFENIEKRIGVEQVGASQAYYLIENQPRADQKMFLGGDNSVHVREREARPQATGARAVGDRVELRAPQYHFSAAPVMKISPEELTRLAATGESLKAVADILGAAQSSLHVKIGGSEALKAAWERGREIYREKKKKNDPQIGVERVMEHSIENETAAAESAGRNPSENPAAVSSLKDRLTPEVFYEAALRGDSTAKIAQQFGVEGKNASKTVDAILYNKSHPERRIAWQRGKAERAALEAAGETPDAPAASTGERIVREAKEAQKDLIEESLSPAENASKKKHKNFANCSGCDQPFLNFSKHIYADGTAFCTDECESRHLSPRVESRAAPAEPATEIMVNPRFEHSLEHISENGRSRERLEAVKANLLETKPLEFPEIEILGRAKIPTDLTVAFDGDFFDLPKEKRIILLQMADLKDRFEEAN